MRRIKFYTLLTCVLVSFSGTALKAQLNTGGVPPSFSYYISREPDAMISVPAPDLADVRKQDSLYPTPYCFGVIIPVEADPQHTGSWTTLPDGTEIWRVMIKAPGALALTAYFDRFNIPDGGKLFLYNPDKSQVIGAYTSLNNPESGYFATELIAGDEMILEYSGTNRDDSRPVIHLNEVAYAYRGVDFLNGNLADNLLSPSCEVNVNCPEGNFWQYQKDGITRIQVKREGRTYWCSGSVINNTNLDKTPYILTANHCGYNSTDPELQMWIFYFNYEAPSCINQYPKPRSLTGAVVKAHSGDQQIAGSDFYLVRMNEIIPDSFHVFYNGWSRAEDVPSPSGVGIHHPNGDIKKISTYTKSLIPVTWEGSTSKTHWQVTWAQTQSGHGVTEGGSSGSPIFDNSGRIIGDLSGGKSACDSISLDGADYYGKFSYSWASNGDSPVRRLRDWLDPVSSNVFTLEGVYLGIDEPRVKKSFTVYPNPFQNSVNIKSSVTSGSIKITLYDLPGRVVFVDRIHVRGEESITIDAGFLPRGIYLLKAETDASVFIHKIIKE